ncbi:MAG: hypothetical protein PHF86_05770 [Candidatus Nanoarchaeia archaeon]|nr:hypothetical protein [Candidatus Nanoarchaeia archaeon]
MNFIQLIAVFIELIIVILSLIIAVKKKKVYGYGFAITFAIYVFYDSVSLFLIEIPEMLLSILFFIATLSALWAIFKLYKLKK